MTLTVEQIAREILAREGGYVDDKDDPGGATNFGVTIHTMRRLGLDIDKDGDVDKDDVRKLTREQAKDIFIREYYVKPGIDKLPEVLRASVFDMQVNSGSNAVKILQRLLQEAGEDVTVDGAIGPQTLKAAHRWVNSAPNTASDAYGVARRNYYYGLADARPASRKYAKRKDGGKGGWITRAEEFISPCHHLSDADHRRRTAGWS